MATFSYSNSFSSGDVVEASEINANFKDLRDFLLTTQLDEDNLKSSAQVGAVKLVFSIESIQNQAKTYWLKAPAGVSLKWKEVQVAFESGSGTVTVNVTADNTSGSHSTALNDGPLTHNSSGTVGNIRSFTGDTAAGGVVKVIISETADNACSNVLVTIWAGTEVRS